VAAATLGAAVASIACGRRSPDLLLVYSSDCQAAFDPCGCTSGPLGGLARRATALESVVRAHPARLGVDAGGWAERLDPARPQLRSQLFVAALHDLGLEIANVSMPDLRLGAAGLQAIADSTGVLLVSANVRVDGAGWLRPYVVLSRQVDGRELRIGVTGVTTGGDPGDDWPQARPHVEAPIAAATAMLELLASQTDVQILLAALPASELDLHIDALGGYEILIAGAGDLREAQQRGGPPLVLAAGSKCKFAAWTTLAIAPPRGIVVSDAEIVALDATVRDEPRMAARVQAIKTLLGDATAAGSAARTVGDNAGTHRVP
jgi:2',3'-cyclic-nucleotide 2'-phosphodiesterase (5'-nucleotidase family)